EVRGWYYDTEVVEILAGLGYTVQYFGVTITNRAELSTAHEAREIQKKQHYSRVKEVKRLASEYREKITSAAWEKGPCAKEEAEFASSLPRVSILDLKGPDIYGGGAWLHLDGNDLYYVRNNGMDGDNWSFNNYPTGGAGAICFKIVGGAHLFHETKAWVDSLGEYQIYAES